MIFKRLRSLLLPLAVCLPLSTLAAPFSNLYVFGDSLSDTGNLNIANGGVLPDLPGFTGPYYQGSRLSNGPVWVEHLATGLGLAGKAAPSLLGGNNYAFAGALTGTDSAPPGVLAQVAGPKALGLWGGNALDQSLADPLALYVVVGGGNDMRAARSAYSGNSAADIAARQQAAIDAITNLSNSIGLLASRGAKNFLISTLPDLGYTPEASLLAMQAGSADLVNASFDASARFNALIPNLLTLGAGYGLNMTLLDMAKLTKDIVTNPTHAAGLGITNTTAPCKGFAFSSGAACENSLFADILHPSAYSHTLIAQAALEALGVPEPDTLALLALAVLALGVVARRRRAA